MADEKTARAHEPAPQGANFAQAVPDLAAMARALQVQEAAENARVAAKVAELRANQPEGGRYIVDGEVVDANGKPVKDAKKD